MMLKSIKMRVAWKRSPFCESDCKIYFLFSEKFIWAFKGKWNKIKKKNVGECVKEFKKIEYKCIIWMEVNDVWG